MPVPAEVPAELKVKLTPEHAEVAPDMDGVFGVPVHAEAEIYVKVISSTTGAAFGSQASVLNVNTNLTVVPARAVKFTCGIAVKLVYADAVFVNLFV